MLYFEKVIYEDVKNDCICQELEFLLEANKSQIEKYAHDNGINLTDVIKQIKLLAPQFEKKHYTTRSFLKRYIFPILDVVFSSFRETFSKYIDLCGANTIQGLAHIKWIGQGKNKELYIICESSVLKAEIKEVDEQIGSIIEDNLHYLKAARKDSVLRLGLFLTGYPWPICYMNFCSVDREDKLIALSKSMNSPIDNQVVIELARVFGCGNLPHNTVSLLIGSAAKYFRRKKYNYMITAVNITLGFTGNSMIASRFVPYAARPVNYYYDDKNQYCTKRTEKFTHSCVYDMPPNILYVREVSQTRGRQLKYCKLVDIYHNYSYNETAIEHEIYNIRRQLEGVWSEKTRYHGTIMDGNSYISKGQCGVSSLLLARLLERRGYEVRFCEGDAIFPDDKNSIYNHCWIKIINYNKRKEDVIIDITSDQNGYKQKILFKTEAELKKLKFNYLDKSEKLPKDIDVEHLIRRLAYLEQELNEEGMNYE